MPSNLYYSEAEGNEIHIVAENGTALETMYRINIGGRAISPVGDTGMFRQWDMEDDYLTEAGISVLPVLITSTDLKFRDNISSYAAPADIYKTARSMGNSPNISLIRSYNLTWEFPVDSGFSYLLRLHFCEIEPPISKIGDRVFPVFIANETAEHNFDVVLYSGGQYKPFYRDYVVLMFGERGQKKINISVALQANPVDANSVYADAILNGLEIFKLSDTTGNLAGPNPDRIPKVVFNTSPSPEKENSNRTTIIEVVSCVPSGLILLCIIGVFIIRQRKKLKESVSSNSQGTPLPTEICGYFSLAEIRAATNNFDDNFIIGVGGFGDVYKAHLNGGATTVAVKRLKSQSSQGAHEFTTEIEM
ncbi:hypothetical protein TIFTF001_056574, partial [Ficus carica]